MNPPRLQVSVYPQPDSCQSRIAPLERALQIHPAIRFDNPTGPMQGWLKEPLIERWIKEHDVLSLGIWPTEMVQRIAVHYVNFIEPKACHSKLQVAIKFGIALDQGNQSSPPRYSLQT